MKHDRNIEAAPAGATRNGFVFAVVSASIVLAAYAVTLAIARQLSPPHALIAGAANMIPTVVFGAAAYRIVRMWIVGRPIVLQAAGHTVLGAAFVIMTYWLLMVVLGAAEGVSAIEFSVRPFSHSGTAWQSLQNVTTYGLIAALAYLHARPASASVDLQDTSDTGRLLSRYFIRSDDDFIPMDVEAIVSIAGADDYCEVATLEGRHLARMSLADFERVLDPARFIRIHRSRIVNLGRIARAEPAGGGRLLVHLENGETIAASRTGSKRLRDHLL